MTNHPNRGKKDNKGVVVTTKYRGVFFGYTDNTDGDSIILTNARNCIQWRGLKGFLDLAVTGPTTSCRIGPAAERLDVRDITSVALCSPAAIEAWEKAPWNK